MPKTYTKKQAPEVLTSGKKFFASLSFRPLQKLFIQPKGRAPSDLEGLPVPSDFFQQASFLAD